MRHYSRTFGTVLAAFLAITLAGCGKGLKEIEKDVLEHDPSFQEMIDLRDTVLGQSASLKSAYISGVEKIDNGISGLQKEIRALDEKKALLKAEYEGNMVKLRQRLIPESESLERRAIEAADLIRRKTSEIDEIEKDIKEVTSLIDKEERLSLSREEVQSWNTRLSSLTGQKDALVKEISGMKKDIEVSRLKIKVLRIR